MSDALKFIPPRVPLIEPRTGLISREWYLFFQGVFDRIGGANSEGIGDVVDAINVATASARPAPTQQLAQAISDLAAAVNAAREPVPRNPLEQIELRVQALEQRCAGIDELRRAVDEVRGYAFAS